MAKKVVERERRNKMRVAIRKMMITGLLRRSPEICLVPALNFLRCSP